MKMDKEHWSSKKRRSPEASERDFEKLNHMQHSLSLASNTIHALKYERDRLKDILSSPDLQKKKETHFEMDFSRNSEKRDSRESIKKQALKDELQNLTRIAMEKDKLISNMEKSINESRIDKSEWRALIGKNQDLKAELVEKDLQIQSLEKRLREYKIDASELKNLSYSYADLKRQFTENINIINLQNTHIKELMCEKAQWRKLEELLIGLLPEHFQLRETQEDIDWRALSDALVSVKNELQEKEKNIQALNKKIKEDSKSSRRISWECMESESPSHRPSLSSPKTERHDELFVQIKELMSIVINKVHLSSFWHQCFKNRFVCSKRFRGMVYNQEYPEITLNFMKLFLDVIDDSCREQASPYHSSLQATNESSTSHLKSFSRRSEKSLSDPYSSSIHSDNLKASWTQTASNKNLQANTKLMFSELNESKSCQANLESKPAIPNKSARGSASLSIPQENHAPRTKVPVPIAADSAKERPAKTDTHKRNGSPLRQGRIFRLQEIRLDSNYKISDEISDEDYEKLYEDSQGLLSIIDKQNSRLAKINSQISNLVPSSSVESIIEGDSDAERDALKRPEGLSLRSRSPLNLTIETKRIQKGVGQIIHAPDPPRKNASSGTPDLGTGKPNQPVPKKVSGNNRLLPKQDSAADLRYSKKGKANSIEKPSTPEEAKLKEDTKQLISECNFPPTPAEENFENDEDLRIEYPDYSDLNHLSDTSSPKNERKRSGWDFSALRIPPKDPPESKIPQVKRALSPRIETKDIEATKKNRSPDRFEEYKRPILRKEDCWDSVGDFFSGTSMDKIKE